MLESDHWVENHGHLNAEFADAARWRDAAGSEVRTACEARVRASQRYVCRLANAWPRAAEALRHYKNAFATALVVKQPVASSAWRAASVTL